MKDLTHEIWNYSSVELDGFEQMKKVGYRIFKVPISDGYKPTPTFKLLDVEVNFDWFE